MIAALLASEAINVNATDHEGNTALHVAARDGPLSLVNMLLATHNVEVDACNVYAETAFSLVISYNGKAVAEILLATGKFR